MTVEEWILSLTHSQELLSNLPICPYAKQAYINKKYHIVDVEYNTISLNIKGGGCAGFEYDWGIVMHPSELTPGDEVVHTDNAGRFVIGATSIMFLIGTEVNYIKSLTGSNFEIINPNAKSSCGCGVSVNFDMDKLAEPAI